MVVLTLSFPLYLCQMIQQKGLSFAQLNKPPDAPLLKLTKAIEGKALQVSMMVGLCMKSILFPVLQLKENDNNKICTVGLTANVVLKFVLCHGKSPKRVA